MLHSAPTQARLRQGKLEVSAGKLDRGKLVDAARAAGRPPPPLGAAAFGVLTPAAVMTDDGHQPAEFSINIDRSGRIVRHVLQGVIRVGGWDPKTPRYAASAGPSFGRNRAAEGWPSSLSNLAARKRFW